MAILYTHSIGNHPQNTMVVFKMRDSVPSPRYSAICNVLRQWKTSLIPTYRVYRLYDMYLTLTSQENSFTTLPSEQCLKGMQWVLDLPELKTLRPSDIHWLAHECYTKVVKRELQFHFECPQHI